MLTTIVRVYSHNVDYIDCIYSRINLKSGFSKSVSFHTTWTLGYLDVSGSAGDRFCQKLNISHRYFSHNFNSFRGCMSKNSEIISIRTVNFHLEREMHNEGQVIITPRNAMEK